MKNANAAIELSEQIEGPKVIARIWRGRQSRFVVVDEVVG